MKPEEKLKEQGLVDENNLWTVGVKPSLVGGAIGAATNLRYIALDDDKLYILVYNKKTFHIEKTYLKEKINDMKLKKGFFGLELKVDFFTDEGKERFTVTSKKKELRAIVEKLVY